MRQQRGFFEYSDAEVSILIPDDLRAKGKQRYFVLRGRRRQNHSIIDVVVDIVRSVERAVAIRTHLQGLAPVNWEDVERRLVRKGESSRHTEGYEVILTSHNLTTGESNHSLEAIYRIGELFVHLVVDGQGEIAEFEEISAQIASSIFLNVMPTCSGVTADRTVPDARLQDAGSPSPASVRDDRSRSHLIARVKGQRGRVHSAAIVGDPLAGGVRLFLLTKSRNSLLPGGSTWHPTEEAAKTHAAESLGIGAADWQARVGTPEWSQAFLRAAEQAMTRYREATCPDPGAGNEGTG